MTLAIHLSPETTKLLRERAAALGLDAAAYVAKMVEEDLRKGIAGDLDWNDVVAAASKSSFAFLQEEPDLPPHGEPVVD